MTTLKNKHNHHTKYDLSDDVEKIKAALKETTNDLKGRAGEMFTDSVENVKDRTIETKDALADYTAKQPFRSLGIALAIGVVIGYLLKK